MIPIHKIHQMTGHRGALYTLLAGATPGSLFSAGSEGWIVRWDTADPDNGRLAATVAHQVFALCQLPEAGQFAAGDMQGGLHWINLEEPEKTRGLAHHRLAIYDLLLHPDGFLFSAGGDGLLTRWDTAAQRSIESLQLSAKALRCLAYAHARRELAVGASDGSIHLLDADTLAIRHSLPQAHLPSVFTLSYSPDERYLLSGGRDAMLRVWDLETGLEKVVSEQAAHWFTINHITYSPDGQYFATASRDKTIKIWDAASFKLLKVLDVIRDGGHVNSVNRLLWLPEGLFSCSDDRSIIWWGSQ
jgi:WD40 repeat protein